MNNNPYMRNYTPIYNSNFNQQNMYEQIDSQINQLQQMREQIKNNTTQQPAINQTFQLAPNSHNGMKYVDTMEDVAKEQVFMDTPFFSKDMSVLWVKNNKGDIKSYELSEIVPKDAKDMQIELLQAQINELKGRIENETNVANANAKQDETDTSANDGATRTTTKKNKSTSV
jgi:hypothetical protein